MLDDTHDTTLSKLRNQALEQVLRSDEEAYYTFGAEKDQFYVSRDGPLPRFCEGISESVRRRLPTRFRAAAAGTKGEFQKEAAAWSGDDENDGGSILGDVEPMPSQMYLCYVCDDHSRYQPLCGPCGSTTPMCERCFDELHHACKYGDDEDTSGCSSDSSDETDAEVLEWDSGDESDSCVRWSEDEAEVLDWHAAEPVDTKVSEDRCSFCEQVFRGSEFGSCANCGQVGRSMYCIRSGLCPGCWGTVDELGLVPPADRPAVTRCDKVTPTGPVDSKIGGPAAADRPRAEDQKRPGPGFSLGPNGERRLTNGERRSMRCKHVARGLVLGVRLLIGLLIFAMSYVGMHGAQHNVQ